uniref:UBC core domain-containing protein n=1 Tax=Dicentrarchus labrax TaxID=13489 RepID=A0A8C4GPS8_DICLA
CSSSQKYHLPVFAELNKNPVEGFSAGLIDDDDIYKWEVVIIGPQDTLFEGGFFKAYLTFPYDYPLRPPKMKFITEIWHPNGKHIRIGCLQPRFCERLSFSAR